MEKEELRSESLAFRRTLTKSERLRRDAAIRQGLESLEVFEGSHRILTYYSFGVEPDTIKTLRSWAGKKQFFLPRLIPGRTFLPLPFKDFKSLIPNSIGIPEPAMKKEDGKPLPLLDLIIVPGVVFDRTGNRIGMGKGYYDRFLMDYPKTPRVALAYHEQVLDCIPRKSYDEPVDMIVTDRGIIRCKS